MPCYHPLSGYRSREGTITQSPRFAIDDNKIQVKCGQCIGCRLAYSRNWAIRCMHEASMWENNCFITLTYNEESLPKWGTLQLEDFQKFMKRLRKKFGAGIRYFHCGEYGERFRRPHYHACLFNFDFPDRELWTVRDDVRLDVSDSLSRLWKFGHTSVGNVTFESAAYVARYVVKKINGRMAIPHYETFDEDTGEVFDRKKEYVTMSRRPGIAYSWFQQFKKDVYPSDEVIVRGVPCNPPKYYDTLYELTNPEGFESLKFSRQDKAKKFRDNTTRERLAVREEVQRLRLNLLKRGYENGV